MIDIPFTTARVHCSAELEQTDRGETMIMDLATGATTRSEGTAATVRLDATHHPLPDNLHPDAATHRLIGERFTTYAFGPRSRFAPPLSALDTSGTSDGALRSVQAARVTSAKERDV